MKNNKFLDFLTLFTSTGTLICCALPALMVAIGAGSVFAGLVTNIPGLIWVSKNKIGVFIFAGLMLTLTAFLKLRAKNLACPIEPDIAEACTGARKFSNYIFAVSLFFYIVGAFFAFLATRFL